MPNHDSFNSFVAPPEPEEQLRAAKLEYSKAMLENDTFFALVRMKLAAPDVAMDLEDFKRSFVCEPQVKFRGDDTIRMSIRLAE